MVMANYWLIRSDFIDYVADTLPLDDSGENGKSSTAITRYYKWKITTAATLTMTNVNTNG